MNGTDKFESQDFRTIKQHQVDIVGSIDELVKSIADAEGRYLTDTPLGNIIHGWSGYLENKKAIKRKWDTQDRVFSLSSASVEKPEDKKTNIRDEDDEPANPYMYKYRGGGAYGNQNRKRTPSSQSAPKSNGRPYKRKKTTKKGDTDPAWVG